MYTTGTKKLMNQHGPFQTSRYLMVDLLSVSTICLCTSILLNCVEKALNAMSKLDKILEQCGQTNPEKLNPCSETETEGKGQHDTSTQILSENSGTGQDISVKISQVLPAATRSLITSENAPRSVSPSVRTNSVEHNASNKKRPRSRKENSKVDPLDPTAGRGKWADALFSQGEYAADTTANGPLYQQRPYLAPGKILRKETKRKR